jgi:hypothetical protein
MIILKTKCLLPNFKQPLCRNNNLSFVQIYRIYSWVIWPTTCWATSYVARMSERLETLLLNFKAFLINWFSNTMLQASFCWSSAAHKGWQSNHQFMIFLHGWKSLKWELDIVVRRDSSMCASQYVTSRFLVAQWFESGHDKEKNESFDHLMNYGKRNFRFLLWFGAFFLSSEGGVICLSFWRQIRAVWRRQAHAEPGTSTSNVRVSEMTWTHCLHPAVKTSPCMRFALFVCAWETFLLFIVTGIIFIVWAQLIPRRSQASSDLTNLVYRAFFTFLFKVFSSIHFVATICCHFFPFDPTRWSGRNYGKLKKGSFVIFAFHQL